MMTPASPCRHSFLGIQFPNPPRVGSLSGSCPCVSPSYLLQLGISKRKTLTLPTLSGTVLQKLIYKALGHYLMTGSKGGTDKGREDSDPWSGARSEQTEKPAPHSWLGPFPTRVT